MMETVDLATLQDGMKKIEQMFIGAAGNVDLMKMSEKPNLYSAWRELREKVREIKRAEKK